MRCRIDRVVSGDDVIVLCISGRITGEHVDTLGEPWNRKRALWPSMSKTFLLSTEKA